MTRACATASSSCIRRSIAFRHQLRSALGEKQNSYPDEEARARSQVVLLDALIQSAELDDAGLAELLAEGRRLADDLPNKQA